MKTIKCVLTMFAVLLVAGLYAGPSFGAVTVRDSGWICDKDEDADSHGDLKKIGNIEKGSKNYFLREIVADTGKRQFVFHYETCTDPSHLKPGETAHSGHPLSGLGLFVNGFGCGWYGGGFMDVLANGEGLINYKPEIDSKCLADEATITCTWDVPAAKVIALISMRNGDDKASVKISIEPKTEIKSLKTTFLCYPSSFAIGDQSKFGRARYIATSKRTIQAGKDVSLGEDECWVLYYDTIWDKAKRQDCSGPCALLFTPTEPDKVDVHVTNYEVITNFTYLSTTKEANYILWPSMGISNQDALATMNSIKLK